MKVLGKSLTIENFQKITFGWIIWYIRHTIHSALRYTPVYPYLFRAYWHSIFHGSKNENTTCYYAALPNPGAGIGHQLANWIAGLWYARKFQLKFAYLPFSNPSWDNFFGFRSTDPSVMELKQFGYKIRRLPYFREGNAIEERWQTRIIKSYEGEKIVFLASQDQFYKNQYGVIDDIQRRFYSASSRTNQVLQYDSQHMNIAIHVRRGDILEDPTNPGLTMRFLSNNYFENVLEQVLGYFRKKTEKPLHIWFFSQGKQEDYPEFASYPNLHWCLDLGVQESFLHMVYADVLITSKSSFSYKPALLNKGVKVCPKNFWHGYPDTKDWIMVENDGTVIWPKE